MLTDAHEYHLQGFLHEFFPRGEQFPAHAVPPQPAELPLAKTPAFSLDDVGTTEIDDAFSVERLRPGELRVGIHIAAPALGFAPGSPLDAIARERLSTAYMPGRKFTMLPPDVIARFSLDSGGERAAVSLYFDVAEEDGTVRGRHSRLERLPMAANLRHAQYEVLNQAFASRRPRRAAVRGRAALAVAARHARSRRGAASRAPGPARRSTRFTSSRAGCASCRASAARRSTSWWRS